jgi:hypothetical protein
MGITAGTKLYLCPTHDLTRRVCVLPMGIKVYPHLGIRVRVPVVWVPVVRVPMGKIAILNYNFNIQKNKIIKFKILKFGKKIKKCQ